MKTLCIAVITLMSAVLPAAAEGNSPVFYKLDFTVKELDGGKTIESHTYSVRMGTMQPNSNASIRTGGKIPVSTGNESSALTSTQFTYIEVGTNFDLRHFSETGGEVSLEIVVDVSSMVNADKPGRPIIRQNKWNSFVSAKVGKPTLLFSSDDLGTKRQMVVEMTATPVH